MRMRIARVIRYTQFVYGGESLQYAEVSLFWSRVRKRPKLNADWIDFPLKFYWLGIPLSSQRYLDLIVPINWRKAFWICLYFLLKFTAV